MFLAAGKERGLLTVAEAQLELAIRTSRVYVMGRDRWCHLHHHGSMDNPALLEQYQTLLL
jgi:hypothetical protein